MVNAQSQRLSISGVHVCVSSAQVLLVVKCKLCQRCRCFTAPLILPILTMGQLHNIKQTDDDIQSISFVQMDCVGEVYPL